MDSKKPPKTLAETVGSIIVVNGQTLLIVRTVGSDLVQVRTNLGETPC